MTDEMLDMALRLADSVRDNGQVPFAPALNVFAGEVRRQRAEIAALREALDGIGWRKVKAGFAGVRVYCIECNRRKTFPEVHAPSCKIGRLFAPEPKP